MSGDLAALWYLERRQTYNRLREVLRQPAKLAAFAVAILYFVFLGVVNSFARHGALAHRAIPEPLASVLFFAFLLAIGFALFGAASGYVAGFSSAADARFLIGSKLDERTVVTWVQLRQCGSMVVRFIWVIVLYVFIYHSIGTRVGIIAAMLSVVLVTTAVPIPMLKLDRATGKPFAKWLASAVILIAAVPFAVLAASWAVPSLSLWATRIESQGFGRFVNALVFGNAAALLALYAFFVLLVVVGYALSADAYPELYEGSTKSLRRRALQRTNPFGARGEEAVASKAIALPSAAERLSGAWSILWRDLKIFSRSKAMLQLFAGGLAASAIVGAGIGIFASSSRDILGVSLSLASAIGNIAVVVVTLLSAVSLAGDLSKPLFWLSADPLRNRLYAWVVSTSWRSVCFITVAFVAWGFATRDLWATVAGIPLAVAFAIFLRALVLAIYSIFPGRTEQRGPFAMIRMLLAYLLIAPPIALAILAGVYGHSAAIGLAVAIVFTLVESFVMVELAALRIDGRGMTIAAAEV